MAADRSCHSSTPGALGCERRRAGPGLPHLAAGETCRGRGASGRVRWFATVRCAVGQAGVVTDELAARRDAREARQAEVDQIAADALELIGTRDLELEAALAEVEKEYPVKNQRPKIVE